QASIERSARRREEKPRSRLQSNRTSKRRCGSLSFGCSPCENSGGASLAINIFCSCRKSSPTPGYWIQRRCRSTPLSHGLRFTIGGKQPSSAREIVSCFSKLADFLR